MSRESDTKRPIVSKAPPRNASREEMALREVGDTAVSRGVSLALVLMFVATISAIPLGQQVSDLRNASRGVRSSWIPQAYEIFGEVPAAWRAFREAAGGPWNRLIAMNRSLLGSIHAYEDDLEEESDFSSTLLPYTQEVFAKLGAGNEKAYLGEDNWLFYRPDVDYVIGPGFLEPDWLRKRVSETSEWQSRPQPDPCRAIVDFRDQLSARGIELVVVPTPSKATVQPAQFSPRLADDAGSVQNASFREFMRRMTEAGVRVYDPTPALVEARTKTGEGEYLETDTHWTPHAMARVAKEVADVVRGYAALPEDETNYRLHKVAVESLGDVARMLRLPKDQDVFRTESVEVSQVLDDRGDFWRPDPSADVLLLGDSFSNIYSLREMGWGESAGFAEHLAYELGRPIDCIVRNDDGSHATRAILSRELGRGRDRLAGKRVVVWQFAARELAFGDWKTLPLTLGEAPPATFLVPPSGSQWTVTGEVEEISHTPRPGTVPYKDHIVSLHLVDVRRSGGDSEPGDAVVYMWSMRDNVWTDAARLRPGDTVRLVLRSWEDVAPDLERINRSELTDEVLQFEEPCWGEPVETPEP